MSTASDVRSGKGHRDENFPVASRLLAKRHRPAILAFYRFARLADDVADHPTLGSDEKLALLGSLEATLLGRNDAEKEAVALRATLDQRCLSPRHALEAGRARRARQTAAVEADGPGRAHAAAANGAAAAAALRSRGATATCLSAASGSAAGCAGARSIRRRARAAASDPHDHGSKNRERQGAETESPS